MYYISSFKYNKDFIKVYGVTDTKDGIEEFYTKEDLGEFVNLGVSIEGLVYTGSDYKCYIKNLSIIMLEKLCKGDCFILLTREAEKYLLYLGEDSLGNFGVFDGEKTFKLKKKDLLDNVYFVKPNTNVDMELELRQSYVKFSPTSCLSL